MCKVIFTQASRQDKRRKITPLSVIRTLTINNAVSAMSSLGSTPRPCSAVAAAVAPAAGPINR